MPTLRLDSKQHKITDDNFEAVPECEFGNFALGYVNDNYKFVPALIGRVENNLRTEIKAAIDSKREEGKNYTHFKCRKAINKEEAYERECKNYHDYLYRKDGSTKQLDNTMHPVKPSGVISCPVVNCNL